MTVKEPHFTIVVVTYNSGDYLTQCIDALCEQTFSDFELLVVDNASQDGSIENLISKHVNLKIIKMEKNMGFAAGNNAAAKQAKGIWLITLNADAIPEPNWLWEINAATKRYPGVAMFGSTQLRFNDPRTLDGAGDHYHPSGLAWRGGEGSPSDIITEDTSVIAPCAAAAIYRRDIYVKLGGMAECFFCYYEDVDLALRFRLKGYIGVQLCSAKVLHVGSATSGRASDFIRYHVSRNRVWTFVRCIPGPLFFVLIPMLLSTVFMRLLLSIPMGDSAVRFKAFSDAVLALPSVWRQRRVIQKARTISAFQFGSAMTWSVGKLVLRARDVRPIPEDIAGHRAKLNSKVKNDF
tara:strand:- start:4065 stop:5114 length:1050 start_codon:yes stop_codon:yes gene_type:complete